MGSQVMIYELASKVNQELVAKKAAKFGPLEVTEYRHRRRLISLASLAECRRAVWPRRELGDPSQPHLHPMPEAAPGAEV